MVLIEVDETRGIYRCKLCGKEFRSFYELDTHMMFGHRLEVENEFNKTQGLPESTTEEVNKYVKKSETILETTDVRKIYSSGDYVLIVNKDTVFRGNNYKELFEAYIKYLYQTYKDFASVDKNLYKMFDELFNNFQLDIDMWSEFFIETAKSDNFTLKYNSKYRNILEYLKHKGFIEDYYKEKNKELD